MVRTFIWLLQGRRLGIRATASIGSLTHRVAVSNHAAHYEPGLCARGLCRPSKRLRPDCTAERTPIDGRVDIARRELDPSTGGRDEQFHATIVLAAANRARVWAGQLGIHGYFSLPQLMHASGRKTCWLQNEQIVRDMGGT